MRQRLVIASSGQHPLNLITSWAWPLLPADRMSTTKPSPSFSRSTPLRTCCLDSEIVTESPRLNLSLSKVTLGGSPSAPISLPGSSQPIMVTFFGSRRPKTPVHGSPSRHHPSRCSSPSLIRCVRRLICRSSSMCSRCMSIQKWPKYSAAATTLSWVTIRAFSLLGSRAPIARRDSFCAALLLISPALLGSTIRMGSGNFVLSRMANHPPVGAPLVSRAFHARPSPPQSFLLIHQPFLMPPGSLR
mmetsp:Transcript_83034/g.177974  ORF Transcript_83034/g.177974 Transcript_83034/m.177974 type:complete len:245 (-) Transcript_83034:917-1651(-)